MHIPFETAIAGGYRFGFTRILTVIGIVWFPMLVLFAILGGVGYLVMPTFLDFLQHLPPPAAGHPPKPDPAQMFALFRIIGAVYLVVLPVIFLFAAMTRVGVMRAALGLNERPVFFFFSLGAQVWRLIAAYILLGLAIYAVVIAVALGGVALWSALHDSAPGLFGALAVVGGIALFCFAIYAFVRTYFFLPAIVVAENRIGLGRSWTLGGGNFWRIVGIGLIVSLPITFAGQIVAQTIMQATVMPQILQHAGGPQTPQQIPALFHALFPVFLRVLPYLAGIQIVQMILLLGVDGGAVASAYKAVTQTGPAPGSLASDMRP